MALSMDEQRMLAEIERRLAAEDPGLAACLTTFRRPGPATVLRSPRARIIGSLFTVLLVALVSLMVYAMIPFRGHGARGPEGPATTAASSPAVRTQAHSAPPNSAVPSTGTAIRAASSGSPAVPSSGSAQGTNGKAATRPASPATGPLPGPCVSCRSSRYARTR
jgi:Protein of unknown function (DUF3040)